MKAWPVGLIKAFNKLVDKTSSPSGCWLWLGGCDPDGYGIFVYENKMYRAHRLALAIRDNIPLPARNIHAAHDCPEIDNPKCVFHVSWKDPKQHKQDHISKGYGAGRYGIPPPPQYGDANGARLHPERLRRGSDCPASKLNEKQVIKIRQMYKTGDWFQAELAAEFDVSQLLISLIVRRKIWKHI